MRIMSEASEISSLLLKLKIGLVKKNIPHSIKILLRNSPRRLLIKVLYD